MDGKMSLGVLCACAGLAACGGGGGGVVVPIVPTIGDLDSALPFGTTSGAAVNMLSTDLTTGVRDDLATITFNADNSFSIVLPSSLTPVTVDGTAIISSPPAFNSELGTTSAELETDDYFIDVHLGEDVLGNDLFILARVVDATGAAVPNPLSYVVFGDETTALPGGNATYTGGFVSEVFDSAGGPGGANPQLSGTATITADFVGNSVGLDFVVTNEGAGVTFTGASTTMSGAQYSGDISSGGGTAFMGTFSGAFYGPNAEGTAGVFNAVDPGVDAGTADDLEIIGGFTGILQ